MNTFHVFVEGVLYRRCGTMEEADALVTQLIASGWKAAWMRVYV